MLKKLFAGVLLLSLLAVLIAACGGSSGSPSTSNEPNTVHLTDSNFAQSSITLTKGSSLTLIDDAAVPHIILNGTWDNGTPKLVIENGAPTVNASFNGNDTHMVGPFNTAGTFHLYCTIHSNMNLTVIVQ